MSTPLNEMLARYKAQIGAVTEMPEVTSHILAHLLASQKGLGVGGDLMEIGVFRAGTASLLATSLDPAQRLFLIDPYQQEAANRTTIQSFAAVQPKQLIFHLTDSMMVNKWREKMLAPQVPLVRFAHIDGEHSYDAVYSDIDLSYRFLAPGGIIALDDIFDTDHACCTHALFDYLRDQPFLHLVAMGCRKAYLCESKSLPQYRRFFEQMPELLGQAGFPVRLCFNSWGHERSYYTFCQCNPADLRYQIIGRRFATFAEAEAAWQKRV
ncbi:MAG: class I SAM-dependent methyltransferase [Opitutus sp.]